MPDLSLSTSFSVSLSLSLSLSLHLSLYLERHPALLRRLVVGSRDRKLCELAQPIPIIFDHRGQLGGAREDKFERLLGANWRDEGAKMTVEFSLSPPSSLSLSLSLYVRLSQQALSPALIHLPLPVSFAHQHSLSLSLSLSDLPSPNTTRRLRMRPSSALWMTSNSPHLRLERGEPWTAR